MEELIKQLRRDLVIRFGASEKNEVLERMFNSVENILKSHDQLKKMNETSMEDELKAELILNGENTILALMMEFIKAHNTK